MYNSMLLFPLWATLTIILGCVVAIIVALLIIVPINIWFRALASGAHVSMFRLIGMKMRKVDYKKLVNIYIVSQKAGLQVPIGELETHLMAGGDIEKVVDADTRLLDTVSEKKVELEEREITLQNQKEELSEARESAEKKRVSLSNMSVVKNSYVKKLSKEEKELQDEITEFQKALKQIESEIAAVSLESISPDYIGGDMRWPVPGYSRITSNFGMRVHPITGVYKLHTGVDISAPEGTNFIAAADGVVVQAYYNSAYGNMVMIDHGGGVVTLYAHGSSIEVSVGDTVKQGQTVLKVGHTGYATGPHAHFEIRVNGEYKNPLNYVSSN